MQFHASHTPDEYLSAMKEQMGDRFAIGSERFTGFFAGRVFYVTHHAGHEWNRRFTNQKNAAMGIVKKTGTGCCVHFMSFRGLLCPLMFISYLIAAMAICLLFKNLGNTVFRLSFALVLTAVVAPFHALFESMTERSRDGHRTLLSFLMDPADPYANYRKIP